MKKFLAIFYGGASDEQKAQTLDDQSQRAFIDAWISWATINKSKIIDNGAPLYRTKTVNSAGISDSANSMTAYAIVKTQTHEEATQMFSTHPHITLHPKNWIEVLEMQTAPEDSE